MKMWFKNCKHICKYYFYCNSSFCSNLWYILDSKNLPSQFDFLVDPVRSYQHFLLTAQNRVIYVIWKQNIVLLFLATRKSSSCNPIWDSKEIMTWTALFILVTKTPKYWWHLQCLYHWPAFTTDCNGRIPEVLGFVAKLASNRITKRVSTLQLLPTLCISIKADFI